MSSYAQITFKTILLTKISLYHSYIRNKARKYDTEQTTITQTNIKEANKITTVRLMTLWSLFTSSYYKYLKGVTHNCGLLYSWREFKVLLIARTIKSQQAVVIKVNQEHTRIYTSKESPYANIIIIKRLHKHSLKFVWKQNPTQTLFHEWNHQHRNIIYNTTLRLLPNIIDGKYTFKLKCIN